MKPRERKTLAMLKGAAESAAIDARPQLGQYMNRHMTADDREAYAKRAHDNKELSLLRKE